MFHVINDKYQTVGPENEYGMRRVQALRNFGDVHAGDIGGYIQDEMNLSDRGSCWVYDDAMVMGSARLIEDSTVHDRAIVKGHSKLEGEAYIGGDVKVNDVTAAGYTHIDCSGEIDTCDFDNFAKIADELDGCHTSVEMYESVMTGRSHATGNIRCYGARLMDEASIAGNENMNDYVEVRKSILRNDSRIDKQSKVINSQLEGRVHVTNGSHVCDCDLVNEITIDNSELEGKTITEPSCYRDGIDIQGQRSELASMFIDSEPEDSEMENCLPGNILF